MNSLQNKYKFYKGDVDSFKTWLDGLGKNSEAYKDIYNSVVWIHPHIGESNISEQDLAVSGSMYAHGVYFGTSSFATKIVFVTFSTDEEAKEITGDPDAVKGTYLRVGRGTTLSPYEYSFVDIRLYVGDNVTIQINDGVVSAKLASIDMEGNIVNPESLATGSYVEERLGWILD